jgi:oligopeptidase B
MGEAVHLQNASRPPIRAPLARQVQQESEVHGDRHQDPFSWLRDRDNPEVREYLEAENAYTDAVLEPLRDFRRALYDEMLSRIQETDASPPYLDRGHYYYSRTEQGLQYPIYCRKWGTLEASEQVLLDLNELGRGEKFMALGGYEVTDDGLWLAYSTDTTGFRQYSLRIKNLSTGELLADRFERVTSAAWAVDNLTLFYTIENDAKRPYRLYRYRRGEDQVQLVYEEEDERFGLQVANSRSREYLFLVSASHTTSEVRFLSSHRPDDDFHLIEPRRPGHEYDVEHHGDRFLVRTNDRGRNFRLVSAPLATPGYQHWKELIPHRMDVMLEGVEPFARHLVLVEREDGLPSMTIIDIATDARHRIHFPEPVYNARPSTNAEFETSTFRFRYESFQTPASVFDYDMTTGERRLVKQTPVRGGFDGSRYRSERLHVMAADGVRIPVSLVYRQDVRRDGEAPLHLYGYGAYGISIPVGFSSNRLSLLDRGVVCGFAHVRGGGELGKSWHDQGRMLAKTNTFSDFISVAEHLIATGRTSPARLTIEGGSAGGLLVGAVLNQRPELFRAAVLHVPFVDVLNTMLDASLPLTVGEYEEWGDPKVKEHYESIKRYCPYTNLAERHYPAMLVRTSLHDSQVMYWEPVKYVAKLRTLAPRPNPVLLYTNLSAGHSGASGRYDRLQEVAFDYAFILWQLGKVDDRAVAVAD